MPARLRSIEARPGQTRVSSSCDLVRLLQELCLRLDIAHQGRSVLELQNLRGRKLARLPPVVEKLCQRHVPGGYEQERVEDDRRRRSEQEQHHLVPAPYVGSPDQVEGR